MPLVTVCVPCYNAGKTILKTLNSIVSQTYKNLEILVVDNVSTDNTVSICRSVKDSRIRIVQNEKNIGGENNWSRSIELATGEYIAVFHSDDLYCPTLVEKQVQAFRQYPEINAVFPMSYLIDPNDRIIGERPLPKELKNKKEVSFDELFVAILTNHNSFLTTPGVMVRGELYKKLAPFRLDIFDTAADLDMWFRISKSGPVVLIDEYLMKYRISPTQGGYLIVSVREEEAAFYKVMDAYLPGVAAHYPIPKNSLDRYELFRNNDRIKRSMNMILNGKTSAAKPLLKQSISPGIFRKLVKNFYNTYSLILVMMGIVLYLSIFVSGERAAAGFFKKIFYYYQFM
ncbi:glycosyltransferase [uncultured Methanoregula sp.]|uniref:glycosyltransferase n=1 Tax=uncultured Methanoregula sp. TaxID=1005933 RepID=UPI002AAAFD85|nr:glycosyltransferase [uncultured Methanoregula sp.]